MLTGGTQAFNIKKLAVFLLRFPFVLRAPALKLKLEIIDCAKLGANSVGIGMIFGKTLLDRSDLDVQPFVFSVQRLNAAAASIPVAGEV